MKHIRKITIGIALIFCAVLIYRLIQPPEMETPLIAKKKVKRGFVKIRTFSKQKKFNERLEKRERERKEAKVDGQEEEIAQQLADFEEVEQEFDAFSKLLKNSCQGLEQIGDEPLIDPNDEVFQDPEEVKEALNFILKTTFDALNYTPEPLSGLNYFLNLYGANTVIKADKIRNLIGSLDFCIVQKMQTFLDTLAEAAQGKELRDEVYKSYLSLAEGFFQAGGSNGNLIAGLGVLKILGQNGFLTIEEKDELDAFYQLVMSNQRDFENNYSERKFNSEKILLILDDISQRQDLSEEFQDFIKRLQSRE